MASFDLRAEPWIPVRWLAGREGPPACGLSELISRADDIAAITLQVPPAAAGLMRILYLITARITGLDDAPDGITEWKQRRRTLYAAGRLDPDAVTAYLDGHAAGLDLFSPDRPWLQDPRLTAQYAGPGAVSKLVPGRPAGNSLVWLTHHTDAAPQPIPASEAAWYLIGWLYYGPSGLCGARTADGTTASNMTSGPLRSRISYHPAGDSLCQTLLAGVPYPGRYETAALPASAPWETSLLPGPLGTPPPVTGLASVLTGQYRHAVLLKPSADCTRVTGAAITWAWRSPHPPHRDPYLIYDTARDAAAEYARYARRDRAVWRDLDALLLNDATTGAGTPAAQPAVFADLPGSLPNGTALRVRTYGFDQDGQPIDRAWFTQTTPPVLTPDDGTEAGWRDARHMAAARQAADQAGAALKGALSRAWLAITRPGDDAKPGTCPWLTRALPAYWAAAERQFWQMTDTRDWDQPHTAFTRLAVTVFDSTTSQYALRGPRAVRALETARRQIRARRQNRGSKEATLADQH